VRAAAPPYAGEGPHALWHVSEDASIERFEPHVPLHKTEVRSRGLGSREEPFEPIAASRGPYVWAIDTRHLPMYWFPRDCPRGTFWAAPETTAADADRLLAGAARVHAVEGAWLDRIRAARMVAYRLPQETFATDPEVGGYWLSTEPVAPLEVVELGDLLARHAAAGIELRIVENLWPLWDRVIASTVEFSGVRLRNASRRPS
jgi:hypothetical protein